MRILSVICGLIKNNLNIFETIIEDIQKVDIILIGGDFNRVELTSKIKMGKLY